jgi:excisionase family DNA binding protein
MEKHVSPRELARKLSLSQETIRRGLRSGEIPGVKVRHSWRIDLEAARLALSNASR